MSQTIETSPETEAAKAVPQSPYCREMRSKRYFFLEGMATQESDLLDGSNHCWCGKTNQSFGPDGELAIPAECGPDRVCYVSVFSEQEYVSLWEPPTEEPA